MIALAMIIVGIYFTPILIITMQTDNSSQDIIDNAVQEFVDDARKSGKITATDYEKMMMIINTAHPLCDIHIIYGEELYIPDGNNAPYQYYDEKGESQILDVIYTDQGDTKDFLMKKGDYIKVSVKNTTPSFGTRIFSLVIPNATSTTTIMVTHGGNVLQNGY